LVLQVLTAVTAWIAFQSGTLPTVSLDNSWSLDSSWIAPVAVVVLAITVLAVLFRSKKPEL